MLNKLQYEALRKVLDEHMEPDAFPTSTISNLYYDTPDFLLIRRSLQKPDYKEKLRLRSYKVPSENSGTFLEIKKKVCGIVYKRRESLPYRQALGYLSGRGKGGSSQIFHELDWMLRSYGNLAPAMFLSYDRISLKGKEDPSLRLTMDTNILWRTECLDLSQGNWGTPLLQPGQRLMEIKISGSMPLWLSHALSELRIFPVSYSKYGRAYQDMLKTLDTQKEERKYA